MDTVFDPTAPGDLTDFGVSGTTSDVTVTFTAPNDAHYFGTRIYRATNSTNFVDAALIHTEYGIPSDGDTYIDPAPGYATFSYWAEPINGSGVAGTLSGPQSVLISDPSP